MKRPGYLPVLFVALGLAAAAPRGQKVAIWATAPQERSMVQPARMQRSSAPVGQEPVKAAPAQIAPEGKDQPPQSDIVIDQNAGEVNIGAGDVVKRVKLLFGKLQIDGEVADDVQMIAGEIQVRGRVYDRVELVTGQVIVSGRVGPGGVNVKFGEVRVSGVVDGPVTIGFGNARVTGKGIIRGDVKVGHGEFNGPKEQVEGSIKVNEPSRRIRISRGGSRPLIAFIGLMALIGLAITILILAILFRSPVRRGVTLMQKENLAWDLLWGLAAILLFLPLFVLLCVTIIGIPVALLLLFLYPAAWLFGVTLLANYLGDWIMTNLIKGQSNFLVGTIFGIIVLGASVAVPVFGPILMGVYTLLALGLSFRLMFGYARDRRKPSGPPEIPVTA
ncbi:MAG: hypothetical protein HY315_06325 [Acidobacteria bacterium]|nr:hypothetical protein [Acidobacteriota bacterium]